MNKKVKRVYILGKAKGAYRTQNFIKYILDRPNEYRLYYNDIWFTPHIVKYLKSIFINPFTILRCSIVYVTTLNVDVNILWELLLSRVFHKKIVIDYYVSVYDTVVVDREWFKKGSLMAKVALMIDRFFLKIGTRVVFLNETEKKRYSENVKMNSDNKKFVIVPLCVEKTGEVHPPLLEKKTSIVKICWWGSYLPLHGLDRILKALALLKQENVLIEAYFFGNNDKKGKQYELLAQQLNVDDICFFNNDYSFKNGKLLPFLVDNCDIALGNFGTSDKSKNVLINKILDACAMKSVLLTCYSNAVSEYFNDNKNLFMAECDPRDIATKIKMIIDTDTEALRRRVNDAYDIYMKEFTVDAYLDRIGSIILKGL